MQSLIFESSLLRVYICTYISNAWRWEKKGKKIFVTQFSWCVECLFINRSSRLKKFFNFYFHNQNLNVGFVSVRRNVRIEVITFCFYWMFFIRSYKKKNLKMCTHLKCGNSSLKQATRTLHAYLKLESRKAAHPRYNRFPEALQTLKEIECVIF